jgi:tRNA(fMet)-specific endonuclease VapC
MAMRYLLDTDVFSEIVRGRHAALMERVSQHALTDFALSLISVGEVRYGQTSKPFGPRRTKRVESLLGTITCLDLDHRVIPHYAKLRAHLERLGTPIGPNDTWIAAHALAEDLTLITGNHREFRRVPGLRVENWLR